MLNNQEHTSPILISELGMLYPTSKSTKKARYGLYKCNCSNEFKAQTRQVDSGHTKSCGCLHKRATTTHGMSRHPMFSIWNNMIARTSNHKSPRFLDYGARGITVCDRWLDINNFIEDMYPSFEEGLTLDRIDCNGNYEPTNCRWANDATQARNTRRIQSNNKSGYRGAYFDKFGNRWRAQICVDRKVISIGRYSSAIEAAIAYDKYVITNKLEHTTNGLL